MWEWTEDRVETLKKLWAKGYSASVCAERLGCGSRNSVIGKVHRLKLANRCKKSSAAQGGRKASGILRKKRTRSSTKVIVSAPVERKPMPPKIKPDQGAPEDMLLVSFDDLMPKQCRWIVGKDRPEDFRFCGLPQRAGSSYCDHHAVVAYAPPRQIRK